MAAEAGGIVESEAKALAPNNELRQQWIFVSAQPLAPLDLSQVACQPILLPTSPSLRVTDKYLTVPVGQHGERRRRQRGAATQLTGAQARTWR
jgi:hypothetical protein